MTPVGPEPDCDKLWYKQPATVWEEALPIGSGRLGAMVNGSTDVDHLWLNEDSVWYGGAQNRVNPLASQNLSKVQELLFRDQAKEAEDLLSRTFTSMPPGKRHYQPLGDVFMHFGHRSEDATDGKAKVDQSTGLKAPDLDGRGRAGQLTDYRRSLDLKTAVAQTSYTMDGVKYAREYFASVSDHVVCVRLSADRSASISFKLRVHRCSLQEPIDVLNCMYDTIEIIPRGLLLKVRCGGEGAVEAAMGVMVVPLGGQEMECDEGSEVVVKRADSVLVIISGKTRETSFRNPDAGNAVLAKLLQSTARPWDELLARHLTIYSPLESRFTLNLGHSEVCRLPTDERLQRLKKSGSNDHSLDPCFTALLVKYSRYLLISCSLSGLPANIQGIWNQDFQPAWGSKFTININVQMNYWPAEVLNLSECHEPLFDFLERLAVRGRQVARGMYGCRGFVAHHSSDLWADAAPQDRYIPSTYWCLGGAWLCLHLWEHFLFTQDRAFLKRVWPVLREAALFFEDFLIEAPEDYLSADVEGEATEKGRKYLVIAPSTSCENTYFIPGTRTAASICVGSTWDSQILYELFTACAVATQVLDESQSQSNGKADVNYSQSREEDRKRYWAVLERLPPPRVGRHGQLQEWARDYEEAEPGHRHISHAFGLYPGYSLSTDRLQNALRVTLQRRLDSGGGHTGWSAAWLLCLYARLGDTEGAMGCLVDKLIGRSTLGNLLGDHPPFHIDGSFGLGAGVAEMLLWSHEENEIEVKLSKDKVRLLRLLPCLPREWEAAGQVTGLCCRGGWIIDLSWKAGSLVEAVIHASRTPAEVGKSQVLCCIDKTRLESGPGEILLEVERGQSVTLTGRWAV